MSVRLPACLLILLFALLKSGEFRSLTCWNAALKIRPPIIYTLYELLYTIHLINLKPTCSLAHNFPISPTLTPSKHINMKSRGWRPRLSNKIEYPKFSLLTYSLGSHVTLAVGSTFALHFVEYFKEQLLNEFSLPLQFIRWIHLFVRASRLPLLKKGAMAALKPNSRQTTSAAFMFHPRTDIVFQIPSCENWTDPA